VGRKCVADYANLMSAALRRGSLLQCRSSCNCRLLYSPY